MFIEHALTKLRKQQRAGEDILWSADVILFEDELHDHGASCRQCGDACVVFGSRSHGRCRAFRQRAVAHLDFAHGAHQPVVGVMVFMT